MRRILLTGGAGFIGSNLIIKLLASPGNLVTCIDNFDPFYSRAIKESNVSTALGNSSFRFIEGDIRDSQLLENLTDIDIIIHLAAKAGVRASISKPKEYNSVNIDGTQNMLEFAKRRGIRQFIFASSSSVYGLNKKLPWQEREMTLPISPYACSKLFGEMLGHTYSHLYNIRFVALRLFTVYGPRQRPDLAIHKFFESIYNGDPIEVYGDGESRRDYTFVGDIADGIISSLNVRNSNYEIINLGNNNSVSLIELIKQIEIVCNKKAIINFSNEEPGDLAATCADISKAQSILNYMPKTDLHSGLLIFNDWYRSQRFLAQET